MPGINLLDRRVRARKDEDDSPEEFSDDASDASEEPSNASLGAGESASDSESAASASHDSQNDDSDDPDASDDDASSSTSSKPTSPHAALAEISFGALASAAASLPPSKKRKRNEAHSSPSNKRTQRSPSPFHEAAERAAGKHAPTPHRTSKHAPTELSSKRAVSRKRMVVPIASVQARDPRFAATSGGVNAQKVERNYAFLDSYRQDELNELKAQIKKTRDVREKERLKGEVKRMEDRERARKRMEEERAVVGEHKKKERERVREGKTPFYLKKGEIKKQALVKRFEGMGEKKIEKVMERRRRKKAGKEKKAMPMGRRALDGE